MKKKSSFSFAKFYQRYGTMLLLVIVFAMAALLSPNFLNITNLTNVMRQIAVIIVIGSGCCLVLISGNINIAYDGLIACIGTASCMVYAKTQNLLIAVIAGLVIGAVFGYTYGIFVTVFEIPGFIVGLAYGSIATGIILLATNSRSVPKTSLGNFKVLGQGSIAGFIPICLIIMVASLTLCHIILSKTCFGMKIRAVGGNREAAIASGINVNRVIRQVFIIDGITCAMGAILFMSRINSGDPSAGAGTCFDAITAVCVGGVSIQGGSGGVFGTLVGGFIVGILNNLLNLLKINSNWQDVISGIVILLAVSIDVIVKQTLNKRIKD